MSFNKVAKQLKNYHYVLYLALALLMNTTFAEVGPNWIEQWGIRWTFDKNISANGTSGTYQYGTFINGDYWVVGPVNIIAINPPCQTVNGRLTNGSQVNPTNNWVQGYDEVAPWYSEQVNVGRNISSSSPLNLPAHSSLVSTTGLATPTSLTQLADAAILTVLPKAADADAFRPAYCGNDKSIRYTKSSIDYSALKKLALVPGTPSLASLERDYERPRIDHAPIPHGQKIRPNNNYNGSPYGRDLAKASTKAALALNLNFTNEEKETLLIRYLQYGIDLFGIIQTDGEGWHGDGGHAGGRKLPILFAGAVLHDSNMKAIGEISGQYLYTDPYGPGNRPPNYKDFGEDAQTFYVSDLEVEITHATWWAPDSRDKAIPYENSDIGLPEWSQTHSHAPKKCTNWWDAIYREVAGCTFPGTAMAAHIMGLKPLWNNPAFFDYSDRYMNVITTDASFAGWQDGTNGVGDFVSNMWDAYRADYGAIWPDSGSTKTTYALSVTSVNGSVLVDPSETVYTEGQIVILTAKADNGYTFEGWSGDTSGTANTVSITMNANKNVTANFSLIPDPDNGGTTEKSISSPAPVAKWNFNESIPGFARDISGNELHATLNATVERSADMGSTVFNGTDSYINCGNNDLLNLGNALTISVWAKIPDPDSDTYMALVSKKIQWDSPSGYQLEYNPGRNHLVALGSGANFAAANVDIDDNWHHIVAVIEGTQGTLYVDGVNQTSDTTINSVIDSQEPVIIGRENNKTEYFKGALDDVTLYNQSLTETDIQELYKKGRNNDLTSHYLFDEINDERVVDDSGCNLDGILVNTPKWGQAWASEEHLCFNGTTQAVEVQIAAPVNAGTLAMLVEPASNSGPQFLFGHTLYDTNMIWLYTISGQLGLGLGNNSTLATNIATLSAGELYHVALTWDGTNYCVYVDGNIAASGTYSGLNEFALTADIANMGTESYRNEGLGFNGIVDDVQIYARTLSANEIKTLMLTQQVKENKELAFTIYGEDQNGNPYVYTAGNLPAGAVFDAATQQFVWRPWYNQSGECQIQFISEDKTDQQTVTLSTRDVQLSDWYRDFLDQQGKL